MLCTSEYFYENDKNKKDGLAPECIKCSVLEASIRQQDHRDELLKYKRLHYLKNQEKMKAQSAENRIGKEDYYSQKRKEFRESEKGKEWYKEYRKKRYKKKHIMYDQEWEECKKYFNHRCAYCGLPIEKHYITYRGKTKLGDFHKEHVIDEGKNDIRNCVPSCNTCNTQKNVKSLNNWYNSSNPNYTYERYYKIYMWLRYDHKKYILPKRKYKNQRMEARIKEVENKKIKIIKGNV